MQDKDEEFFYHRMKINCLASKLIIEFYNFKVLNSKIINFRN
jgi:hypothetical protein